MLKIAGVTVKTPSELKVGRFDLTKSKPHRLWKDDDGAYCDKAASGLCMEDAA